MAMKKLVGVVLVLFGLSSLADAIVLNPLSFYAYPGLHSAAMKVVEARGKMFSPLPRTHVITPEIREEAARMDDSWRRPR
jgi:hypothetical protein